MTAAVRTFRLIKIRNGYYLCPSNDAKSVWRFVKYWEDGSLESVESDGTRHQIRGWFWTSDRCALSAAEFQDLLDVDGIRHEDDLDELDWSVMDSLLRTRQDAIDMMIGYSS